MARLLVADDDGVPWVEIATDDGGAHTTTCGTCQWQAPIYKLYPIADHIEDARIHVDNQH